jgi:hypothetical protein
VNSVYVFAADGSMMGRGLYKSLHTRDGMLRFISEAFSSLRMTVWDSIGAWI